MSAHRASSCAGVMSRVTVTRLSGGSSTSAAVRRSKVSAPWSRESSSSSSRPWRPDSATKSCTCAEVKVESTSSFGVALNSLRTRKLAVEFISVMNGRMTSTKMCSGTAMIDAVIGGLAMAMFLGTISPITMCRKVTISRAMTSAIGWTSASGTPHSRNGPSMREAMAGSPTEPMISEHAVMPSCVAASWTETSSMPRRAYFAPGRPARAIGSTWSRRAETMANSAATKNALSASMATRTVRATEVLI